MSILNYRAHVASSFFGGVKLFIVREMAGAFHVLAPARLDAGNWGEPVDPNMIVPATLELNATMAQEVMDGLWQAGIRPAQAHGSTGQLAATERHLEDMRKLVFEHPTQRTL